VSWSSDLRRFTYEKRVAARTGVEPSSEVSWVYVITAEVCTNQRINRTHSKSAFCRSAQNCAVPVSEFARKLLSVCAGRTSAHPQRFPGNWQRESAQETLVLFVAALYHAVKRFCQVRIFWKVIVLLWVCAVATLATRPPWTVHIF